MGRPGRETYNIYGCGRALDRDVCRLRPNRHTWIRWGRLEQLQRTDPNGRTLYLSFVCLGWPLARHPPSFDLGWLCTQRARPISCQHINFKRPATIDHAMPSPKVHAGAMPAAFIQCQPPKKIHHTVYVGVLASGRHTCQHTKGAGIRPRHLSRGHASTLAGIKKGWRFPP